MNNKTKDATMHFQLPTNIIDNLPSKEQLIELIEHIQHNVLDNNSGIEEDEFSRTSLDITIASDGKDPNDWGYQTGDNSYSGACYFYRHWAIGYIDDQTIAEHLAVELLDQLEECLAYEKLEC